MGKKKKKDMVKTSDLCIKTCSVNTAFNRKPHVWEFRVRAKEFPMQISLMFMLVTRIRHADQQNAAWFECDCTLTMDHFPHKIVTAPLDF